MAHILDEIIMTDTLNLPFDEHIAYAPGEPEYEFDVQVLEIRSVWTVYRVTPINFHLYDPNDPNNKPLYVAELPYTRMPSEKTVYLVAILNRQPQLGELLDLSQRLLRDEDG